MLESYAFGKYFSRGVSGVLEFLVFTLIYGGDDIVGAHANTPLKGLDLMVPQKNFSQQGMLCV